MPNRMFENLTADKQAQELRYILRTAGAVLTDGQIATLVSAIGGTDEGRAVAGWLACLPPVDQRGALVIQPILSLEGDDLSSNSGLALLFLGAAAIIGHEGKIDRKHAEEVMKRLGVVEDAKRRVVLDAVAAEKNDRDWTVPALTFMKRAAPVILEAIATMAGARLAGAKGASIGLLGAAAAERMLGVESK